MNIGDKEEMKREWTERITFATWLLSSSEQEKKKTKKGTIGPMFVHMT